MPLDMPFKIFTPTPILGYGYNIDEFWAVIDDEQPPAAIIVDAGSTDPGPYMLGTGKTLCSRQSYIRDLTPILGACATKGSKFIVSSAGGAGTNSQVDTTVDIIREVAHLNGWAFKLATIKFDEDRSYIASRVVDGLVNPCSSAPPLDDGAVERASAIVAQMGAEPFVQVLRDESVDIVVAGRSYDPAPFAAFCILQGVEESTAWHVGKIIECGGLCAVPKGRSIVATMHRDYFELTPTDQMQRCTPWSVAAHTLYEKTRPDRLPGPGGVLHLDSCTYDIGRDDRTVEVRGSRFVRSANYEIKLEGAEHIGYRTIYVGGIRDPILIEGINDFIQTVRDTTEESFPAVGKAGGPQLIFHIYGRNAVMGQLEPLQSTSHELGILGEVVAETQDMADAVAGFSRTVLLHGSYDGQVNTGGNLALPLTPLETSMGPVFAFSLYHLMQVEDPTALFPLELLTIERKEAALIESRPSTTQQRRAPAKAAPNNAAVRTESGDDWATHPGPVEIQQLASVIRSKNSGPFEITLDILFTSRAAFERARRSNVLTTQRLQSLYGLESADDIVFLGFFEPALAWKCTFKRPWPQGSVGERDTFGTQMHAPLLSILVDTEIQVSESTAEEQARL